MTIEEAIETLTDLRDDIITLWGPDHIDAMKLGIEALRWRQHCKKDNPDVDFVLLPGETNE
jgi:hypothetical protein